jgi:hypothetical protein
MIEIMDRVRPAFISLLRRKKIRLIDGYYTRNPARRTGKLPTASAAVRFGVGRGGALTSLRGRVVFRNALGKSIPVNAQLGGGVAKVSIVAGERGLNVKFFEFLNCFNQKDVPIQHFFNKIFNPASQFHNRREA